MTDEARRHDLYHGLMEVLGEERAGTLMAYLPTHDGDGLATQTDVASVRDDLTGLEQGVNQRLDIMTAAIDSLGRRVDRLTFALIAGLIAVVAALLA